MAQTQLQNTWLLNRTHPSLPLLFVPSSLPGTIKVYMSPQRSMFNSLSMTNSHNCTTEQNYRNWKQKNSQAGYFLEKFALPFHFKVKELPYIIMFLSFYYALFQKLLSLCLLTWTFSWCWWFWWRGWRLQMWGRYIPGTTQNTIVPIFCTPLSFSFSADLVTQTM
jgi:hypothetical protein